MPRPRTLAALAPLAAIGLLASANPAAAQQVAPPAQVVVQPAPTLAPLPGPQPQVVQQAAPQGPTTVIIQQPYPQQVYPGAPPVQGQPYYVQQAPLSPPAAPSGPRIIKGWDDAQPIPAGYHLESHARTGLVVGGAVLFGTMYLISALVAAGDADAHSGSSNPAGALWAPAIGPFIQMTQTSSATAGLFLAIDGLAQIGGIAMFTAGLASPRTDLVRNDFGLHLSVAPIVGRDHTGLGLVGTF
jgi:hypothetical protein